MIEWNNSSSSFFADNIPSKVKEQSYAAATTKRYKILDYISIVTFCFVYNLHTLDSSGCPGEKGRSFRK
jgi:hypothetical protein